ncbi:MAG: 50S ribosomal protein L3 [Candidatus Andersenbacteria bacterium]
MKVLLGRKIGMSQVFAENGKAIPVTLIAAEPNTALIHRTEEKDGYAAVQLALPRKKDVKQDEKKQTPSVLKRMYAMRKEFKGTFTAEQSTFTVEQFEPGDVVEVSGMSKGKGFAGVVKRHHFKGGPASHGHRHVLRRPGSIGSRFPQHVLKGMRMAGRMGYDRVTVKNLTIVAVDKDRNLLAVKGAVPGTKGTVLEIRQVEEAK